jgi:hypothetical protein
VELVVLDQLVLSKMTFDSEQILTGAEIDTLFAIVERGPLRNDDLPSKSGRNGLISLGFVLEISRPDGEQFYAVTPKGVHWYSVRKQKSSLL